MSIEFPVSDVVRAPKPLEVLDRDKRLRSLLAAPVEALSPGEETLVEATDRNAFVQAAYLAFDRHYPLVLSPDAVWFCIAQGFAHHIAENAAQLRSRLVRHQGTKELVVDRPDFELGQPNPWPEVFAAFSEQIGEHVGKLRELLVADFSTTGPVERAASELVVMDAFQPYFEYKMSIGCGIPSITLLGTPADWKRLAARAEVLAEYELGWWTKELGPVLAAFVQAAEGRADAEFWRSFFRFRSSSGGSELTGWIHVLFPYLTRWKDSPRAWKRHGVEPNPYLVDWQARWERNQGYQGPGLGDIPSSLASAPVRLNHLRTGANHPLRFVGGLFGVSQDATSLALRPEFGWAIVHAVQPD